jgi:hypothetical protein
MSTYKSPLAITGVPNYGKHGKGTANYTTLKSIFPNSPIYGDTYDATKDGAGNTIEDKKGDKFATIDDAMLAQVGLDSTGKQILPSIQSLSTLPGVWGETPNLSFAGPTAAPSSEIELGNRIPNIKAPNNAGVPSFPNSTQDLTEAPAPSTLGATGKTQPGTGDYTTTKPSTTIVTLGSYLKNSVVGPDGVGGTSHKWDAIDESPNQYATMAVIEADPPKED